MHDLRDAWIGVDVGATAVKAYVVLGAPSELTADHALERELQARDAVPAFRASPVEYQLADAARGVPRLSRAEEVLARARVEHVFHAVAELVGTAASRSGVTWRMALCAAGRTDRFRRGWVALRNGPRDPRFLDRLTERLSVDPRTRGVVPPDGIHSDAVAAVWGELAGREGALRGARDAYWVGCGTGVAEGLLAAGEPVGLPSEWRPPWQAGPDGVCAEDRVSIRALVRAWDRARVPADPRYPEVAARAGGLAGSEVLGSFARALAAFVAGRLTLLAEAERSVDRVVLGQRAGGFLADAELEPVFGVPFSEALDRHLSAEGPTRDLYAGRATRPGFVVPSALRAAPAIGAVALARRALDERIQRPAVGPPGRERERTGPPDRTTAR